MQRPLLAIGFAFALSFVSCGTGTGAVQVFVTPEATITDGLSPGPGEDDVQDGWTVTYDKFLVSLGHFEARTASGLSLSDGGRVYLADLKALGSDGESVLVWKDASAERYEKFSYAFVKSDTPERLNGIADADFTMMIAEGYTLFVSGAIEKGSERVTFALGYKGETSFGACAAEEGGPGGFAVVDRGTIAIKPTIHGDHWFFTSDPHVTTPRRLAGWLARADVNGDHQVTSAELVTATNVATLFPPADYSLGGLPVTPIQNAFHFFGGMARTVGHFNGDGDCEDIRVLSLDPEDPASLGVETPSDDQTYRPKKY